MRMLGQFNYLLSKKRRAPFIFHTQLVTLRSLQSTYNTYAPPWYRFKLFLSFTEGNRIKGGKARKREAPEQAIFSPFAYIYDYIFWYKFNENLRKCKSQEWVIQRKFLRHRACLPALSRAANWNRKFRLLEIMLEGRGGAEAHTIQRFQSNSQRILVYILHKETINEANYSLRCRGRNSILNARDDVSPFILYLFYTVLTRT